MKVLIVEDEKILRISLDKSLQKAGYAVVACDDGLKAISLVKKERFDIVLTDIRLPNADGYEILAYLQKRSPDTKVIMMTAFGSIEAAVTALKQGAEDYLTKPFSKEELLHRFAKIRDYQSVLEENRKLKKQLKTDKIIIGNAPLLNKALEQVSLAAPKDYTILIEGQSGTGKELVVNLIHKLSVRKNKPLIKVNCSALPETLFESELFGHEKGAFTGAIKQNIGRFERANGGTLFFDDIDDLPLSMQVKLLRVIQEQEIERVGGNKSIPINVRIIAATKVDLLEKVKSGLFRDDLYYRINVIKIILPTLKERSSDVPLLVSHFLKKHGEDHIVSPSLMENLIAYNWPGNVRELENIIVQMIAVSKSNILRKSLLPGQFLKKTEPVKAETTKVLSSTLATSEMTMIKEALEQCQWRQKDAAELLGIPRTTLRSKMEKYELI